MVCGMENDTKRRKECAVGRSEGVPFVQPVPKFKTGNPENTRFLAFLC
jgi:hypothetical protein